MKIKLSLEAGDKHFAVASEYNPIEDMAKHLELSTLLIAEWWRDQELKEDGCKR